MKQRRARDRNRLRRGPTCRVALTILAALTCAAVTARADIQSTTAGTGGREGIAITVGADGGVWMLSQSPRRPALVRISSRSGQSTAFSIPDELAGLEPDLVAAQDGNLWYSDSEGPRRRNDRVVRTTLNGARTPFPAGIGRLELITSLAAGPANRLYFDAYAQRGYTVSSFSLSGRFPRLAFSRRQPCNHPPVRRQTPGSTWLPDGYEVSRPGRIRPIVGTGCPGAIDGAGNFWYQTGLDIDRLAPSGKLTVFPAPEDSGIRSMAPGPDGNIWFVVSTDVGPPSEAGEIDPQGHITRYPVPNGAPIALTAGPDGRMWIPDNSAFPHIIRIAPKPPATGWPKAARPRISAIGTARGGLALSVRCRGNPGLYCGGRLTLTATAGRRRVKLERTLYLAGDSQGLDLVFRPRGISALVGQHATVTGTFSTQDFLGRRGHAVLRRRLLIN